MSASKSQWTCNYCGDDFEPRDDGKPFCDDDDDECHEKYIGEKVINQLKTDRRFCATTFAQIREQHSPGRFAWSGSVLRDDDGTPVEYRHSIPDTVGPSEDYTAYGRKMQADHGCLSPEGTLRHDETIRPNPPQDALIYAAHLSDAVETLRREGARDVDHDHDILMDEMWSFDRDNEDVGGADYARALGKAIVAAQN